MIGINRRNERKGEGYKEAIKYQFNLQANKYYVGRGVYSALGISYTSIEDRKTSHIDIAS